MVVRHHRRIAAREVRHGDADHRVENGVGISGACLLDGLQPHVEADIMRFHRVVGHALVVLGIGLPGLDELGIGRRVDRLEIVPCRQMPDKRSGIEAGEFLFANREGDDRDILSLHALVRQFLVEGYVGIAVDG
ncbi:hypothetical protein D9M72_490360 [compost metagenome]